MVYIDVPSTMHIDSFGDSKYFVTFLYDASQKVWVYFAKTKDQMFLPIKKFHVMVEGETGKTLKCLCSANGGEYTSNELEA